MEPLKKIINSTKYTILAEKTEVANTPFRRLKGLLGRTSLEEGHSLVIKPCSSIHTFFMQFPIDVIFLDKDNKVAALAEALRPWRLFGAPLKGKLVIELPSGTITRTKTSKGDTIEIG